ncbi:hypothetical protein BGX28_010327 [Mortierella sp. GBA30]|nr:hypothetical protein BGX28_010327 [Mortierella sp. GBA30]
MQPKDGARLKAQKSKRNHMQALSAFDINILYLETCTGKKRKQSPTPEKDDHPSKQQKSKNIQDWRRNRGKGKAIVNTSVNDSAQENIPPAMSGQQPSTPAARKKAVVKPKTPRKKTAATSIRANAAAAASAVTEHAVGLSSTLTPETTSQDKAIVARGATITDHSPIKSRIDMVTEMEAQVDMEQAEASASSDSAPIITQRTSTVEEKAQARTRATGSR